MVNIPPVAIGYEYALEIRVAGTDEVFPENALLRAQVRARETSAEVITELTSDNGGLTRVDGHTVEVRIPASVTANLGKQIVFDLVRDDDYLYLRLQVTTLKPITRPT
jgi:hypothetical protein